MSKAHIYLHDTEDSKLCEKSVQNVIVSLTKFKTVGDLKEHALKIFKLMDQKGINDALLKLTDHIVVYHDTDPIGAIIASAKAAGIAQENGLVSLGLHINHEPEGTRLVAIAKKKQNGRWGLGKSGWTDKFITLDGHAENEGFLRYYRVPNLKGKRLQDILDPKQARGCINLFQARLYQRGRRLELQTDRKSYMFEFDRPEYDHVNVWNRNIAAISARLSVRGSAMEGVNKWPVYIPGKCAQCFRKRSRKDCTCQVCLVEMCPDHISSNGKCDKCEKHKRLSVIKAIDEEKDVKNSQKRLSLLKEEVDFVYENKMPVIIDGKKVRWCECCGGQWAEWKSPTPKVYSKEKSSVVVEAKTVPERVEYHFCKKCNFPRIYVEVCVVEAKDLKVTDLNGLADPYCKILIEDEEFQTDRVNTTLHPVWGSEDSQWFRKHILGLAHGIHISIYDWDRITGDDFMGYAYLPLKSIPEKGEYRKWIPLQGIPGHPKEELGEVYIIARITIPWKSYIGPIPEVRLEKSGRATAKTLGEAFDALTGAIDKIQEIVKAFKSQNLKETLEDLRFWRYPTATLYATLVLLYIVMYLPYQAVPAVPIVVIMMILTANWVQSVRARLIEEDKIKLDNLETKHFHHHGQKKSKNYRGIKTNEHAEAKPKSKPSDEKDKNIWWISKIQKQKEKIIKGLNEAAEAVEMVDRVYGLILWRDGRRTRLILALLIVASIALSIVPFRLVAAGGVIGMFFDYLLSKKYLKEENFQKFEINPDYYPAAAAQELPFSMLRRLHFGAPQYRKKKHKNDPLKDFIRRSPLKEDIVVTKKSLPRELQKLV
mmetsp:Transcript_4558/g.6818  ORF Transcript_4558/g.6818 Transcript_4558/m.6818 type:complete len:823 (+) Transcript_4558:59-2527(+)